MNPHLTTHTCLRLRRTLTSSAFGIIKLACTPHYIYMPPPIGNDPHPILKAPFTHFTLTRRTSSRRSRSRSRSRSRERERERDRDRHLGMRTSHRSTRSSHRSTRSSHRSSESRSRSRTRSRSRSRSRSRERGYARRRYRSGRWGVLPVGAQNVSVRWWGAGALLRFFQDGCPGSYRLVFWRRVEESVWHGLCCVRSWIEHARLHVCEHIVYMPVTKL